MGQAKGKLHVKKQSFSQQKARKLACPNISWMTRQAVASIWAPDLQCQKQPPAERQKLPAGCPSINTVSGHMWLGHVNAASAWKLCFCTPMLAIVHWQLWKCKLKKKGLEGGSPQACWREDNSEHLLHFLDTNHAWPKFQAFAISSPCAGCQTVLVKVPALTTSHCKHIHVQEALQSFMVRVGLWTRFLLARLKVSHQFLQLGACFLRRQHLLSQTPVLLDQALHCFFLFLVAYLQAWRDKLGKHLLKGKGQGCTETAEDKQ